MRKFYLVLVVIFLAACSDNPSESKWVAQALPNEQQEKAPILDGKVAIYTPTTNTVGYVIKQQERDKWILANADQVASHPYSLVHEDLLTLGETYAIDVKHNMAIIHIRNSYDYSVKDLSSFTNSNEISASKDQIDAFLDEAIEQKIDWQQRLKKNKELGYEEQKLAENFTTYYSKNIFTYNVDELKEAAMLFIDQLNLYIREQNAENLVYFIDSDDVYQKLKFLKTTIEDFTVKEAYKEGIYYFVNGIDKQKNEVRMTFITEQQQFKLIGANFLSDELLLQEQIPQIVLTENTTYQSVPALQMFIKKHIPAIKIAVGELLWQLEQKDRKLIVTNGNTKFTCDSLDLTDNHITLTGCKNTKKENYIIATVK